MSGPDGKPLPLDAQLCFSLYSTTIAINYKDGTSLYLAADAIGGRDEYGQLVVIVRGVKSRARAWKGSRTTKEEIISQVHRTIASGYCQQVSFLS